MGLPEHDAQWAGDNGAVILGPGSDVDENCAPQCSPGYHIC